MQRFLVTIESDEPNLLRRIDLLHAAMYRTLRVSTLRDVQEADYGEGKLVLDVVGRRPDPMIAEGSVREHFEAVPWE